MLKITYFGHTAFALESKETTVLLNPGFMNDEPIVPDDFDTRVVIVTNDNDDALGNATKIAENSKAWILGNKMTIDKVESQGGKPWLLHVLKSEEPYQIPGFKVTPYSLQRGDTQTDEIIDNLGLYIEMGTMKVSYLGDTIVRGPFGKLETDLLVTPIGGGDVFPLKDAVSLCIDAKPHLTIPYRWSSSDQPDKFVKYIKQFGERTIPIVMEPEQTLEVHWAAGNEFRHKLS